MLRPWLNGSQRLEYRGARTGDHHPRGLALVLRPGERGGVHPEAIGSGELGATLALLAGLPEGRTVCGHVTMPTLDAPDENGSS